MCYTGYEPDRLVPLFTSDAVWDGGERFGAYRGTDEIHRFFEGASQMITWALHYMVAPIIEVALRCWWRGDTTRSARGSSVAH